MNITVRPECAADYEIVADLLKSAFNTEVYADFVASLRKSSEYFDPAMSLVAEGEDGILVGYILLFPLPHSDRKILALHPMAIIPELQKKGIGKALINEGMRIARMRGYGGAVVMGPGKYYRRFGFRLAEEWGIFPDFNVAGNDFLAYEFEVCGLTPGLVRYPLEFREYGYTEAEAGPQREAL